VKFTTAKNLENISQGEINFETNVDFKFFFQSLSYLTSCNEFAFTTGKRGVINNKI